MFAVQILLTYKPDIPIVRLSIKMSHQNVQGRVFMRSIKFVACIFIIIFFSFFLITCSGGGGGDSDGSTSSAKHSISGTVSGALGVTIHLTGTTNTAGPVTASAITDAGGNYSFTDLANGTYTVTPYLKGYTFDPHSILITVSNKSVTLEQLTGTQAIACSTLSISPASNSFPPGIGTGTVTVKASSSCPWTPAVSNASWLTVSSFTNSGGGIVNYSLSANPSNTSRTGQIFIGPEIFNVTQAAQTCHFSIFPSADFSVSRAGDSGSVSVTVSSSATGGSVSNCPWIAASNNDWIIIDGANSGSGDGTVSYTVEPNTGAGQRTGTMTIAGETFTVTQAKGGVTGTWSGTSNCPDLGISGCHGGMLSTSISLTEDADNNITGSTGSGRTITGKRIGNSITVTEGTDWGTRGPYTWTWDGNNTITGSAPYICYSLDTYAFLSEGPAPFTVTRY
jgi:hypothetical protein